MRPSHRTPLGVTISLALLLCVGCGEGEPQSPPASDGETPPASSDEGEQPEPLDDPLGGEDSVPTRRPGPSGG